jgi:hypothetical protein
VPLPAEAAGEIETKLRRFPRLDVRNLITVAALLTLAIGLTVIAMRGDRQGRLDADIRVVSVEDPLEIGATTRARVTVVNHGSRAIHPRFSVSSLSYPHFWGAVAGPPVLAAGETADYTIEAPDATAAPQDGATFQIRVNDARSITYVIAPSITTKAAALPIVNPRLGLWTQRDASTGVVFPSGWYFYRHQGDGDKTTIERASVFGVDGARFRVVQDGQPDPGSWTYIGLSENIPFPDRPFEATELSRAPFHADQGGWPLNAFGLEVDDGVNNLLWLLFQPTGHGDLDYNLPTGHHVHVYDVPFGSWAKVPIDLKAAYEHLGWAPESHLTLKLFIAAASTQPDEIDGYIAGIAPAAKGSGQGQTRPQ